MVPRIDVGQTHSGSLEGKSTFIVWNLAPRCKSIKKVVTITFPPALSQPLLTLFPRRWISSPTSAFIVRRFCLFACFLDFQRVLFVFPSRLQFGFLFLMASTPEMTNEGTSTLGEPFVFPSYVNIGPPHITTLSLPGLTIGLLVWLFSTQES